MNLEMVDGFYAALICAPELISISEYLTEVLGEALFAYGGEVRQRLAARLWRMVHEQEKESIRTGLSALNAGLEGFTSRLAQLRVVAAVANALARCRESGQAAVDGGHLQLIEAGTGVGKSFGALVPALVMARSRRKHLVVSTSTVALQHQYAEKDVPTLQRLRRPWPKAGAAMPVSPS